MGIFDWFRGPPPEVRLERARAALARGHAAEARLEAIDLAELPGAGDLRAEAEAALARSNLDAAVSWARAGDHERVQHHLEVAASFRGPGLEAAFDEAHAQIRAFEGERQAAAAVRQRAEASKLLEVDRRFVERTDTLSIPLPEGIDEDEAEALEARLAMLHDAYPEALRAQLLELGPDFAQAILDLEDGQADRALTTLLALPDDVPAVQYELGRAARTLGDPAAAARSWRRFVELHGDHAVIGDVHTGVRLAEALAASGDPTGALDVLRTLRKQDPKLGDALWAPLLEATGQLGAAEAAYRDLLRTRGTDPAIYLGIARVRLAGGHRVQAMQALETSLRQNDCQPGSCGARPPDLATHRLLATLYLEDGTDLDRGLEVADVALSLVREPRWEDRYLEALVARATEDLGWTEQVDALIGALPDGDPRRDRVTTHLPLPA